MVNGTYEAKVPCLNKYVEKVKGILKSFNHFELERIPQLKNDCTDTLTKLASIRIPKGNQLVIQSIMLAPLIETSDFMCVDMHVNGI